MKNKVITSFLLLLLFLCGCSAIQTNPIKENEYLQYQPVDPIPVTSIVEDGMTLKWSAIDKKKRYEYLPIQSTEINIRKTDVNGKVDILSSSLAGAEGNYEVIMDFMKFRLEPVYENGKIIGYGKIGVGLRIKALITTFSTNINISGLSALGAQFQANNLKGSLSVQIIGLDSKDITNLLPFNAELDQSSIQIAIQGLSAIKAKLWDYDDTSITPFVIAIRQDEKDKIEQIKTNFTESFKYANTATSKVLTDYWMPDGKKVDEEHAKILRDWMDKNGLKTGPGYLTEFLHRPEFELLRKKVIADIQLNK